MRALAAIMTLAGCDRVFDITDTRLDEHLACEVGADDLDEDNDGVANRFDTCPGVPDRNQEDDDGDGVGNACDPDPDAPSTFSDLAYFVTDAGCWIPDATDHWTFGGSATSAVAVMSELLQRSTESTPSIETAFASRTPTAPNGYFSVTVALNYPNSPAHCFVRLYDEADGTRFLYAQTDVEGNSSMLPRFASTIRLRATRDGTRLRCEANGVIVDAEDRATPEPAALALRTEQTVAFEYAIVYGTP